jgi:membrane protease YdiL (CAAX protease family)
MVAFFALSCYLIFAMFQTMGLLIYHLTAGQRFVLDFSRHGLLESGSIIAGIYEEIILRGVIVAVLLARFAKRKTVLVSAGLFAGLHLLNMLNREAQRAWVLCQVIWAFGLGLMYVYILVEWRSLFPLILLHYLINALVGVWFRGLDTRTLISGLYGIPFFGLLPAGLVMLWTKYLSSRGVFAERRP